MTEKFLTLSQTVEDLFKEIKSGSLLPYEYISKNAIFDPTKLLITSLKTPLRRYLILCIAKTSLIDHLAELDSLSDRKKIIQIFRQVGVLLQQMWSEFEEVYGPENLLLGIKEAAKLHVINLMLQHNIPTTIATELLDILHINAGAGGSFKMFGKLLFNKVSGLSVESERLTREQCDILVIDTINGYSAAYDRLLAADLNVEWYNYRNSNLINTRHFCLAMKERKFFHISEIPYLLRSGELKFSDYDGKESVVSLSPDTNLPFGMRPNTTASDFLIFRGGIGCGHSISPTSGSLVKSQSPTLYSQIISSDNFKGW